MAELPRGLVTFLFTDIVDSTALWERYPEVMGEQLARHDHLLCELISAHHGVVFKGVGDGFRAVFTRAEDALTAAIACQRAILGEPWEGIEAPRVRMAILTGAAELRGDDYFGSTLNRVSRLTTLALGGEILLGRTTVELVRDSLPADVALIDLGEHHLRSLQRPEHIFRVAAPGLPDLADAGSLTDRMERRARAWQSDDLSPWPATDESESGTATSRPEAGGWRRATFQTGPSSQPIRTVPRQSVPNLDAPLVGREQLVARLRALLSRDDLRLLTLTGPGGVGKTSVAISLGHELRGQFPDGAVFVSLGSLSDPGLLASTIAQTLGVRDIVGQPIAESLQEYLRDKRMLLLLDNFEQLLRESEAAEASSVPRQEVGRAPTARKLISDLCGSCPGLKLLISSRAPLQLHAEQEFPIPPLQVPDHGDASDLAALAEIPAVRVFVQRAQSIQPDFALTPDTAPVVSEICRRLDGLPLAIELAAAHVRALPPKQVLALLDRRLTALAGGPRDAPARQLSLRDTIDWSYRLLDEPARRLFRRLAVFAGGWTLEAAVAVCAEEAESAWDTLDLLTELISQSLVERPTAPGDDARYTMLETIRAYAWERLEASGELTALQRRHAEYFLRTAEALESELTGPNQRTCRSRLKLEHDNLRAVLAWSLGTGETELGIRLAASIWRCWLGHGYASEGLLWLQTALHRDEPEREPSGTTVRPEVRARAMIATGELACGVGDVESALEWSRKSSALFKQLGERARAAGDRETLEWCRAGEAASLHILGWCRAASATTDDHYREAAEHQDACRWLHHELGNSLGEAKALHESGEIMRYLGDHRRSRERLEQARDMRLALEDYEGAGWTYHCLAWLDLDLGDFAAATRWADEAVAAWQDLGPAYEPGIAATYGLRARIAWKEGDLSRAAAEFLVSLKRWESLQHREWLGFDLQVLAALAVARDPSPAGAALADWWLATARSVRGTIPLPRHRWGEVAEIEAAIGRQLTADALAEARKGRKTLPAHEAARRAIETAAAWSQEETRERGSGRAQNGHP